MRRWEVRELDEMPQNYDSAEGPWIVFLIQGSRGGGSENRNAEMLERLRDMGAGTLFLDLLPDGREASTPEEIQALLQGGIRRALELLDGLRAEGRETIPMGIIGSGFGGAVALKVAGERPDLVKAVACTGGPGNPRKEFLSKLRIPTLFHSAPVEEGETEKVARDVWVWFQEHLFPKGPSPDRKPWAQLARPRKNGDVDADGAEKGQKDPGTRESPPEELLFLRLPPDR